VVLLPDDVLGERPALVDLGTALQKHPERSPEPHGQRDLWERAGKSPGPPFGPAVPLQRRLTVGRVGDDAADVLGREGRRHLAAVTVEDPDPALLEVRLHADALRAIESKRSRNAVGVALASRFESWPIPMAASSARGRSALIHTSGAAPGPHFRDEGSIPKA